VKDDLCEKVVLRKILGSHALLFFRKVDDYLTVHLHKNNEKKQRVWYPGKSGDCIMMGAYTNSPQVLIRYDVTSNADKYLSLVLSQYKKTRDIPYTLSIFGTEDFALCQPPKSPEHLIELTSSWTATTAGGPIGSASYTKNPMFAVQIPKGGATIELRLATTKAAAINAILAPVSEFGERIDRNPGQPVVDTGNYRFGFVVARSVVKPGPYVLIVSSYSPGQQAVFQVKVFSSAKLKIKEISTN
jgi:hypothetical protein